jgi:hypothetical protein
MWLPVFFVLMDFGFIAIQNSFNMMESMSYGFYFSRYWVMKISEGC